MLSYEPGDSFAHGLDPRSKLAFQAGFAIAAFAHTTLAGLVVLTPIAVLTVWAAGLSVRRAIRAYWLLLPFLLAGPVVEAVRLGPPWIDPAAAVDPALASYRVLLVLLLATAYVRTTPVRETRAAIQRTVPGRPGQFLGLGVAFVLRFLPVLRRDLAQIREAMAARLGERRPVHERMALVATTGLNRAFSRADRFALALRARCLAWNPTPPPLSPGPRDWLVAGAALGLAAMALL